ncbi:MAG: MATE family efflux transporter [Paludibacteraceae bacterium]|nr:MATE family efflux transporter [Paludibacteraceae bacterium]
MNKEILRIAIPAMLANITIPLVGLVDVAIAGHIADASAIAGIAVATTIFDLMYWGFGFLRVGTGGMTAQAYGATDWGRCSEVFVQSTSIAIAGALLIWAIQWPFSELVLRFMDCDAATEVFARQYFRIRVWAAPATLLLMMLKGWFIGMQDTVVPMVSDLTVNIINMACSYWLAVVMGMGVEGVAAGTVIAQYTGLVVTLVLLAAKHHSLFKGTEILNCVRWKKLKSLFVLNSNIFVRSICFMVIYVGFTKLSTLYGTTEVALGAIVMKLFMLFSYMVDGFAYAGEALTGRFIGAKARENLSLAVRLLFRWSMALAVVTSVFFLLWGQDCISIISSDTTVREASGKLMPYIVLMPLVSAVAFMWDGIYAGATAGREIRNCMIVAVISFLLGFYICKPWAGIHALYMAYFAHLAGRVVYCTVKYPIMVRRWI